MGGPVIQQGGGASPSAISAAAGFRNRLINGNGAINQRVATSVADDTYAWDRHYVLTQTASIGVSALSDVADGLPSMMRLTQSQASAQRMGVAQIIESVNCKDLRGQAVTLLGKLRCSSAQAIRYAILEWTGTADAVTSDVVASWTNSTFTAGQFFNSTTLTVTAVGTLTPTANTVTDFLLSTTLGSSGNNVIVFIWTEGTAAQNVTLDVAWEFVKGNQTGQTYPLEVRDRQTELMLAERYFRKIASVGAFNGIFGVGYVTAATTARIFLTSAYRVAMRTTPSVALSAAGDFVILDAGANRDVTSTAGLAAGSNYHALTVTCSGGGMTAGQGCLLGDDGNGVAAINFDSEL